MDLVRSELLPPILIRDMHREAQRQSLVDLATWRGRRRSPALRTRFGSALILTGCRVQVAGRRLAAASHLADPLPCGCGA